MNTKISRVPVFTLVVAALTLPVSASLVGHWTFDEGGGTNIADSSGWGNNGVLVNPKPDTWSNGIIGPGLYFDGTTGSGSTYVAIPDADSLQITNAISFAAWVRCDDINRDAPILDKEGNGKLSYWFGAYGPGHFGVLLSTNGNQPWTLYDRNQGNIPQGLWVHLASTWDGATVRHYLNGVLLPQTTAFIGPLHVSDASLIIGANFPYSSTAFKGIIDDARLYNHALSPEEIRALAGITPQMVGYWTFDEGSGTNIADSSGLGNNGVLIHPQTNTWTTGKVGGALYFDGTTGAGSTYVAVPDSASLHIAAGISFAAWVRCDDISRDAPILAKEGDGKLSYWFGAFGRTTDGGGTTPMPGNFGVLLSADGNQPWTTYDRNQGAIPQGQWVHLASTWDGNTIRHYVNGQPLPETGTFAGPVHYSDAFLAIGVNSLYNYTAFKGAIDDVRLYNYALTPAEVNDLYLASAFELVAVSIAGTNFTFSFQTKNKTSYTVEYNDDLATTNWQLLESRTGDGSLMQYLVPMTNTTQRFFRVVRP